MLARAVECFAVGAQLVSWWKAASLSAWLTSAVVVPKSLRRKAAILPVSTSVLSHETDMTPMDTTNVGGLRLFLSGKANDNTHGYAWDLFSATTNRKHLLAHE